VSGDLRTRAVLRDLRQEGWTFTLTAKNHYRGTHPEVLDGFLVVPGTMGRGRAEANVRALARRLVRAARVGSPT